MAQLEIRDARGDVSTVELTRTTPALVGSGPACSIVLESSQVRKVHCRILWREDRWRVEVAADAPGVELRGKTVKAGTVTPGDVIGIGDCQIRLRDGGPESAEQPAAGLLEELGQDVLEQAAVADRLAPALKAPQKRGMLRKLMDVIVKGDQDAPPGEESLVKSRLVHVLLVSVTLIGILFIYFYNHSVQVAKAELFDRADAAMSAERWKDAILRFQEFLEKYPSDDRASAARVRISLCELSAASRAEDALSVANKMLLEQSKEQAFLDAIPKLGQALRDLARTQAQNAKRPDDTPLDRAAVNQARAAYDMSGRVEDFINSRLPGAAFSEEALRELNEIREAALRTIRKSEEYLKTIEGMTKAIDANNTFEAYVLYDALHMKHSDFAEKSPEILELLRKANERDREAVVFDPATRNAETEPRPSSVDSSTVLANRAGGGDSATPTSDVVFVIAGGVCNALDVDTGKLVWRQTVGNDTRWLPIRIAGSEYVLLIDSRNNELLALERLTGKLAWRQAVGGSLETVPLVKDGRIFQPTSEGNLAVLDAVSGRMLGQLKLGKQRLSNTPIEDRRGRFLYLLGEQFNLYTIEIGNPPKCVAVDYLGHKQETIQAAPLRLDRYLVICENHAANQFRIRVFLISEDGSSLREIQQITEGLRGTVSYAPAVRGNIILVANDQADVRVYSSEGQIERGEGFRFMRALQRSPAAAGPRGQSYAVAYSDNDFLVCAQGVQHYHYELEESALTPKDELLKGSAIQPIQLVPETGTPRQLVVAHRLEDGSVTVTSLNAMDLSQKWQETLAPGVVSIIPGGMNSGELAVLTTAGDVYKVTAEDLRGGGVLDNPERRDLAQVNLLSGAPALALASGVTVLLPQRGHGFLVMREPGGAMKRVDLPAPISGSAAVLGDALLVPGADHAIHLVDVATGKEVAEPFLPSLSLDEEQSWAGVGTSDQGQILAIETSGRMYQLELQKQLVPALRVHAGMESGLPVPIRSSVAVAGAAGCCVDETNTLQVIDVAQLNVLATRQLPTTVSLGPVSVAGHIFIVAGTELVVCVNGAGKLVWENALQGHTLAGIPSVRDGVVYLALTNGRVERINLDDGTILPAIDTDRTLAGSPVALDTMIVVPGIDGSLNVLSGGTRF